MNLTSKSRYAMKIMMDFAFHSDSEQIIRQDIAQRQGVPTKYLDQILLRLRASNLVVSVRGRNGGYRLGRSPELISVWDIFTAVEDNLIPVECIDHEHACNFEAACVSREAWAAIFAAVRAPLERLSLASMTGSYATKFQMCPVGGVRECRHGHNPLLDEQRRRRASRVAAAKQSAAAGVDVGVATLAPATENPEFRMEGRA